MTQTNNNSDQPPFEDSIDSGNDPDRRSGADDSGPNRREGGRRGRLQGLFLRILLLAAGMFAAALGISLIALLNLGSTPISTIPLVAAAVSGLSFGTTTFFVNLVFVFGQIALLRRRFNPLNLLQIPVVFVFSLFIDGSMALLDPVGRANLSYLPALLLSLAGNVLLAAGIVMQIRSKTIVQPGEGIVLAVAVTARKPFGTMKVCNDVSLVALAAAIGWFFLGEIVQIREGTLISAVSVGFLVKGIDALRERISKSNHSQETQTRE